MSIELRRTSPNYAEFESPEELQTSASRPGTLSFSATAFTFGNPSAIRLGMLAEGL